MSREHTGGVENLTKSTDERAISSWELMSDDNTLHRGTTGSLEKRDGVWME